MVVYTPGTSNGLTLLDAASIIFEPGSEQVKSDIKVLWDLDGDGDFDEPEEDITEYVLNAGTTVGRNSASQLLGRAAPGKFKAVLNNADDRFSFFNDASPLNTAPFNVRSSTRVRVQTAGTPLTGVDPVFLACDYFDNTGNLNNDVFGNSWQAAIGCSKDGAMMFSKTDLVRPYIDVGEDDCFIQGLISRYHHDSTMGILYRHKSDGTSGLVYSTTFGDFMYVYHVKVDSTSTVLENKGFVGSSEFCDDRYLGVHVHGSTVDIYIDGELLGSQSATTADGQGAGLYMNNGVNLQYNRGFGEFKVWDKLPVETEGVLWTGRVSTCHPSVSSSYVKTVQFEGEGVMSTIANADITTVDSVGDSTNYSPGLTAGQFIGNVVLKAGVAPLGKIESDITIGPTTNRLIKSLTAAREAENMEFGRLLETPEGYIRFDSRSTRDSGDLKSTWTDADNTGGFSAEDIIVNDWRSEKRNRVTSAVGAMVPTVDLIFTATNSVAPGGSNQISIGSGIWASCEVGQLLVSLIIFSTAHDGENWLTPSGWRDIRQDSSTGDESLGKFRVYGHIVTEEDLEFEPTNIFYKDTNTKGGAVIIKTYLIDNFYGSLAEGLHVTSTGFKNGHMTAAAKRGVITHKGVAPPWGGQPTLHIFARLGHNTTEDGGGTFETPDNTSIPYQSHNENSTKVDGANDSKDIVGTYALKNSSRAPINAFRFYNDQRGYQNLELIDVMVRGFVGEDNDRQLLYVTTDNLESQRESGGVLSYDLSGLNFNSVADAEAFNQLILDKFSEDRPTLKLSFTATKSGAHRMQAIRNRLGDRVYVDKTKRSGMGLAGVYAIESISHSFSEGGTLWTVEWGLAPV